MPDITGWIAHVTTRSVVHLSSLLKSFVALLPLQWVVAGWGGATGAVLRPSPSLHSGGRPGYVRKCGESQESGERTL